MLLLEGQPVTLIRGDIARTMAQRTVFSARRMLPEVNDVISPTAVSRYAYLLRSTLGEPSYIIHRALEGPIEVWVVSLKNNNGIISFELWQNTDMPLYYIFTDKPTPIVAKVLSKLYRYLNTPNMYVLPKQNSDYML